MLIDNSRTQEVKSRLFCSTLNNNNNKLCSSNNNNNDATATTRPTTTNNIFQDRFKKIKILGKGNFGEVFLAEEIATQKKVAIKVVDTTRFKNDDQRNHAENEKEICKLFSHIDIKHQHIVDVLEVSVDEYFIYFVLEYVDGGELYERIKMEGKISEPQAKIWFRELIEAIEYIHKHGIVHRDLKPENVLVDKSGSIRLCDFGFGKIFDASKLLDTYCGSPLYAAPELVTATPYRGPPADMWSCGVILYVMLTGQLPFHCDTMPELFKKISLAQYPEPRSLSAEALGLIKALLSRNPKRRITAENVLKHAWLNDHQHINTAANIRKKIIKKIPSSANATFSKYYHHNRSTAVTAAAAAAAAVTRNNSIYPPIITINNTSLVSPASALPSPVVSVGDEELASYYSTPDQQQQQQHDHHHHQRPIFSSSSKATRFLLHALNKKSQVAPSSREKQEQQNTFSAAKKGSSRALLITAERIKRFFANSFIQKRFMTM